MNDRKRSADPAPPKFISTAAPAPLVAGATAPKRNNINTMPRGRPVPKGPDDHRFFVLPAGPPQDAKTMRARRHGAGLQNIARNRAVRQPAADRKSTRLNSSH